MALVFTNTLTGKKEAFTPLVPGQVSMYVCGLTPYDEAHIGHARAYVAYDVMRRWLERKGLHIKHIQNITDVDDRIIARAHEKGMDPLAFAAEVHARCEEAFLKLRLKRPESYPKVSEHISGIIEMTERLIAKGHAYVGQDENGKSVYFSVESDPDYGKLSRLNRDELLKGVRKDVAEGKRHPGDFALWKASKPNEGVSWGSPWGRGRPGWHIECSVMSAAMLGKTIDIHGGGWDLIFPHHENELAQSESASGEPFVRFWLHVGFLTVEGEKMSKSLGNFTTLNAALTEWRPEALRLWFAGVHYRSPIDYSTAALEQSEKTVQRFENMLANAQHFLTMGHKDLRESDRAFLASLETRRKSFEDAMDDDLNTPKALAALLEVVGDVNRYLADPQRESLEKGLAIFRSMAEIFDVLPETKAASTDTVPLLNLLLEARELARKAKAFPVSDHIRDGLAALDYVIEDTATGPRARRK